MTRNELQPRAALAGILLALFALLAAACGSAAVEAGVSTTEAMGDIDQMEDGGEHGDDVEHGDEHGDEHGTATVDVPAEGAPEIGIEVIEADEGFVIEVDLANFTLTEPDVAEEYVAGEGHVHLYVDSVKIGRFYETPIPLDPLPAGEHIIEVEVNASDHSALAIDGVAIRARADVSVAEGEGVAATEADRVVAVGYAGGEVTVESGTIEVDSGSTVEVRVSSDVAEHVHVHGYDIFGDLTPGEELVLSFTATIAGVFEVELEDSGKLLFDLQVR